MSRMFRVISGPSNDPFGERGPETLSLHREAGGEDGVPYVEVGGPEGVVHSIPKVQAAPAMSRTAPNSYAAPAAVRMPVPPMPAPQAYVPPADEPSDPRYLSVTFHRIPKAGLRMMQSGVAPEIVAFHFPDHPISGEYRTVRDEIVRQFDEPGSKVSLFASAASAAGTTTVLVNLAVSLAAEFGSRMLLVDANLARPGIARRLGCAEAPRLAEVIGQSIPLAWALQPTPVANVHVLAAGTPGDHTEEAMANEFPKLLAQLRQWFDWVVVDAGVWGDLPSAEATFANTDAVYLVTRSGDIELPGFGSLRSDISQLGGRVRGYISTRQ